MCSGSTAYWSIQDSDHATRRITNQPRVQGQIDAITLQLVFLLSRERLGRRRLARRAGLSEMTVRIQLERLHDQGFLVLDKSGSALTSAGKDRFAPILHHVADVQQLSLYSLALNTITVVALLSHAEQQHPSWWYRDHAVRGGASAMILIRCCADGLRFSHSKEQIGVDNPRDEQVIEAAFPFRREGDLLLLVSAPDRKSAGLGLWRVITEILSETP